METTNKLGLKRYITLGLYIILSITILSAKNIQPKGTVLFDYKNSEDLWRRTLISQVIQYGNEYVDTIEISTITPLVYFNDKYSYNSTPEIIDAFPNAEIYLFQLWHSPPVETYVISEYRDTLSYICDIHDDNLPFYLQDGILYTNSQLVISKYFQIGSTLDDVIKFLGLDILGIPLSIINYRTIIISPTELTPNRYWMISNAEFSHIIVDMVNNKIVSIRFK